MAIIVTILIIFTAINIYLPILINGYIIDPTLTPRTFIGANEFCKENYNSTLASIYTPEQNVKAIDICLEHDGTGYSCWIGLHKNYSKYGDNKWHWIENGLIASFYDLVIRTK